MKRYVLFSVLFHAGLLVTFLVTIPKLPPLRGSAHPISVELIAALQEPGDKGTDVSSTKSSLKQALVKQNPSKQSAALPPSLKLKSIESNVQTEPRSAPPGPGGQTLDYAHQLKHFIEQNKFYPKSARRLKQAGLVRLKLQIDSEGKFHEVQIVEGCHHELLNQAALSLIKQLGRFKPLPKELASGTDFIIPIAYHLSGTSI